MKIQHPKFLPGQEVFILNPETKIVTREMIHSICWHDDGKGWEYLCDIEIAENEVLCSNFSDVMEILNG